MTEFFILLYIFSPELSLFIGSALKTPLESFYERDICPQRALGSEPLAL